MVHRLRQDYPRLRVLALTIDNTFMSPVALTNISSVVAKLGLAHTIIRPPAAMMERMFRHAFLNLNAKGCSGTVDQVDGDVFIDIGRNYASRNGIPLVLVGLSVVQTEEILKTFSVCLSGPLHDQDRRHIAHMAVRDFLSESEIREFLWCPSQVSKERHPTLAFPYYAWRLTEPEIKLQVENLGLLDSRFQHPMITNSSLIPLMGVVDVKRLGFSSFEPEFARMVREGRADKTEWLYTFELLEYAANTGKFLGDSVKTPLKRLGLTLKELGIE